MGVVDDDDRVLQSLQNLLESAGHEVHLYSGPGPALSDPDFSKVECLVTDVAMPDMDGVELGRRVRELRPSLPIVFITAHDLADRIGDIAASGSTLLRKPFDGQALLTAIDRAIGD